MNKKILGLALVSGFAFTAGAQAATVSFSDSTAHVVTELETATSSLDFGQFDSSLGTLNSISIELSGESISSSALENTSAQNQRFSFVSDLEWEFEVLAGSGNFLTGFTTALADTGGRISLASGATTILGPNTDTGSFTVNIAAADFGQFIGGGNAAVGCNTFTGSTFSGGGGNIANVQSTTGSCAGAITYDYTASSVSVPEPASLALLGLGLGFMGFTRRNKKA